MSASITAFYAALLALFTTVLAINVTVHRGKHKVTVGDGGNAHMLRMVRLHGNAVEYIPLALVLMLLFEIDGGQHSILHVAGIVLVAARILHAWGLSKSDKPNFGRVSGQSFTWLTIAALAVLNLWKIA